MDDNQYYELAQQAGAVFTPGSPVNEKDLFAGRLEQIDEVLRAAGQRGYHAVIYGERGVGKTSLANILGVVLGQRWLVPRVNCDGTDSFSTLWRKALQDILISKSRRGIGFMAPDTVEHESLINNLPLELTPDDVRRTLEQVSSGTRLLIVFDEFDRLSDKQVTQLMSDTIKALSDYAVDATILLIGVADSVDDLVIGHQSVERALVQIPMPRMSPEEIAQIVTTGLTRLGMSMEESARGELVALSQGLPYITHLLAYHSVVSSLKARRTKVTSTDVDAGIKASLQQWQQSVVRSYYDATQSSQPGNIYKQVLLACALAETDDLGFFYAAAVRPPLRVITEKEYDIPNFAQHLKNFSDVGRGGMLARVGEKRRIRYRFTSPLMRPYIIMRGYADGLLDRKQMKSIAAAKALAARP